MSRLQSVTLQMKLMQQHSSVPGQPPEKKLRVVGGYNSTDPTNYEYQVRRPVVTLRDRWFLFLFPEKPQSVSTTATTKTLLICT